MFRLEALVEQVETSVHDRAYRVFQIFLILTGVVVLDDAQQVSNYSLMVIYTN